MEIFKAAKYIHQDGTIEDLTDIIEISNLGHVYHLKKKIYIKIHYKSEYPFVRIRKKDYFIHRLILSTFKPESDTYECINHKDENRNNSILDNLEWCSRYYNNTYNDKMNKVSTKGLFNNKTTPVFQFNLDGSFVKEWASAMEFQRQTGNKASKIYQCCKGTRKSIYGYKWSYTENLS